MSASSSREYVADLGREDEEEDDKDDDEDRFKFEAEQLLVLLMLLVLQTASRSSRAADEASHCNRERNCFTGKKYIY